VIDSPLRRPTGFLACALAVVVAILFPQVATSQIASSPGAALSESIDVLVVNFEVVVTDANGAPVRGLTREDFALVVDGAATKIDYLSEVEGGVLVDDVEGDDESAEEMALPENQSYKPLLVVVFDGRDLDPGWLGKTAEDVLSQLPQIVATTRGVMVVRQGTTLETEQVFTMDLGLLESAIERAAQHRAVALEVRERNALIRDIERAASPQFASSEGEALQVQAQAEVLLRQIRSYQDLETYALERSVAQLRSLIRSLAGLPGRKELLYLGRGFKQRPAAPLFELWWRKFSSIGPKIGLMSVQSEIGLETVNTKLLSLIEEANAQQVTFNTYAPGGVRSAGAATQFSSMESAEALDGESDRQMRFLKTLASSTGGVSEARQVAMSPLVGEMISGFQNFYSLGFDLTADMPGPGRVKVTVKDSDYRVRHLDRYRVRPAERTLEDLTLSALVTDLADNPLQLSVDVDSPSKQKDGTFVVPILIKVPISMLALLPEATRHVGKLQLVVQAQSAEGDLSAPVQGEIPIEIENKDLLNALGSHAGYRLRMRVSAGEQRIAVAIRDEIARTESALNLIIDAGGSK
jgi:VWFA-related protein